MTDRPAILTNGPVTITPGATGPGESWMYLRDDVTYEWIGPVFLDPDTHRRYLHVARRDADGQFLDGLIWADNVTFHTSAAQDKFFNDKSTVSRGSTRPGAHPSLLSRLKTWLKG